MSAVSPFAILSVIGASLGFGTAAVLFTVVLLYKKKKILSGVDKGIIVWLLYNAITHLLLEMSFLYYSLTSTVSKSSGLLAEVWREYAKADSRWGEADPTIVSLELLTVFFNGPLCLLLVYAILTDQPYRHFIQISLNTCELYGGWMTFCPEWLQGSPDLDTSNWLYLWVYLVFFNGLWVVVPSFLLYHSYKILCGGHRKKY